MLNSRNIVLSAVFLFFSLLLAAQQKKAVNQQRLARLKTALIYSFTRNIYWPQEDRMTEFRICVMNSPKLAEQLEELEHKTRFRNRLPVRVISCRDASELTNCHMLVVDGSTGENLWALYAKIRHKPVLMVAENLEDYKKSMVSFLIIEDRLKFIVNKTKMDESNLTVMPEFYAAAITREGEWKSIFDKFQALLRSGDAEVKLDKSDLAQMLTEFKQLEKEKLGRDYTISMMEDSLKSKMELLNRKMEEYRRVSHEVAKQQLVLAGLEKQMAKHKKDLIIKRQEITKQRIVIGLIAALTMVVLVLLLLAIRVNGHRRKANKLLSVQKHEIEKQKYLVETKQKEILDSINYARRIQTALMASDRLISSHLPEYFIFFRPKDIVAGDFYWAESVDGCFMYATADSTGHGVPGAFMSLLNISKLNEAINQKKIIRPDLVLNDVRREIVDALNPEGTTEESKDGMDVVLCKLDTANLVLQYAAANSSFCIVRNNEALNCRADKMPVGKSHDDQTLFTLNEMKLQKGDMIYTFTDGFADQFGGPAGKKLKVKYMKNILTKISALPVTHQKETLARYFEDWKGTLEQVDDVLVMGVRV